MCYSQNNSKVMTMEICTSSGEGQRKRVRWAPQHVQATHDITHLNEMSMEEISDAWYQKHQYVAFKRECLYVWHLSINGEIKNNSDWCERGLEHIIDDDRRKNREWHKKCAMSSVLETQRIQRLQQEQQRQVDDGTSNKIGSPELLAELYQQTSSLAQLEAHSRGLQDELAVVKSELQLPNTKKSIRPQSISSSSPHHARKKMRYFDSHVTTLRVC